MDRDRHGANSAAVPGCHCCHCCHYRADGLRRRAGRVAHGDACSDVSSPVNNSAVADPHNHPDGATDTGSATNTHARCHCESGDHRNGITNSGAHRHSGADAYADRYNCAHPHSNRDANARSHADSGANPCANPDRYACSHVHPHAGGDANANQPRSAIP